VLRALVRNEMCYGRPKDSYSACVVGGIFQGCGKCAHWSPDNFHRLLIYLDYEHAAHGRPTHFLNVYFVMCN